MKIRIKKIEEKIPYILIICLVFVTIIQASLLIYVNEALAEKIYLVGLVVRILLCISLLLLKSLNKKELLNIILIIAVSIISYIAIQSYTVFDLFFVSIAYKGKYDYKKMVSGFLNISLVAFFLILFLYYIQYFPSFSVYRYGTTQIRLSYGFSHPNVCGRMILNLCILYVLKKRENITILGIIIMVYAAYWVYSYPNSITSALMIVLLVCFIIGAKLYKALFRKEIVSGMIFRLIGVIVVPLVFVIVFYLVINSRDGSVLENISATFYSRFWGGFDAIKRYPINLWGHKISFVTAAQQYFGNTLERYFAIDCLYVLLPVRYGIIVTIYFVYQLHGIIKTSLKRKDTYMFLAIMILLLYSVAENGLIVAYSSYIFILAGASYLEERDAC